MRIETIPVDQLDHEELHVAAVAYHEAQAALRTSKRAVEHLAGGRALARQRDAEAAVEARLSGKAAPARRRHEEKFEKDLAEAERELAEAEIMAQRTRELLQAAAREHGKDWADRVEAQAAAADELYHAAVSALLQLHEERLRAHSRCRLAGRAHDVADMVRFHPSKLVDSTTGSRLELARLDDPAARWAQRALVRLDDVLEAVAHAGEPEDVPPMPAYQIADRFALAARHARNVERGFSDEEIESGKVGTIAERAHVNGVQVYMPTGRGGESDW